MLDKAKLVPTAIAPRLRSEKEVCPSTLYWYRYGRYRWRYQHLTLSGTIEIYGKLPRLLERQVYRYILIVPLKELLRSPSSRIPQLLYYIDVLRTKPVIHGVKY